MSRWPALWTAGRDPHPEAERQLTIVRPLAR
jgi:hypothetical protein